MANCVFVGRMIKLGRKEEGSMWSEDELNEFFKHLLTGTPCALCTLYHRGLYDHIYRDTSITETDQTSWNDGVDLLFKKYDPRITHQEVWRGYDKFLSEKVQGPSPAKQMNDMFRQSLGIAQATRFLTRR